MKVVHALEPIGTSIFLAGPTPRDPKVETWRPEALSILAELGYDGTVYVPESADWAKHDRYDDQIGWEWQALDMATVIVFWIPRDLSLTENGEMKMPAFTTNVEFGLLARSGKCFLGAPGPAEKMSYLRKLASATGMEIHDDLRETLEAAVERTRHMF
jgi:hypothetical protein